MKTFLLAKLDTPCTLNKSVMHVPSAEPLNFALSLCDSTTDETIHVVMLGLEHSKLEVGEHTIEVVPYYGQTNRIKDIVDSDTQVIIWQGRHIVDVNLDRPSSQLNSIPVITKPRVAAYFEKLNMLTLWQINLYNLLSSTLLKDCKMHCIITDVRLPLIDVHKVDKVAVPQPLPKGIILLTQTYKADDYMLYHNAHGHGIPWLESTISDYVYQFKHAKYIPLHSLPIWSHVDARKKNELRTFGRYDRDQFAVCQIQSMKYLDEYRIEQLQELVRRCDGKVSIMGRMGHDEKAVIRQKFPVHAELLLSLVAGSSDEPIAFHEAAEQLTRFERSLVITDGRYSRFGLMPNRMVEALATHTMPMVHEMVYRNTDSLVTSIIEEIDQCIYENGSVSVSIYDRLINLLKRQLLLSYGKIFDIATDIVEPTKADVVTAVGNVWTTKRLTKASK
jgi:hypothetical protein